MKQVTKVSPDPGAKEFEVVNMDQENVYIHPLILPYTIVDPSESVATDVAFFDGEKVIIVRANDYSQLPKSWMPIGVVVVPGTHNVYGDGSCGIMSLKGMDCNNPEVGSPTSVDQGMSFGVFGTDIPSLPNLTRSPIIGNGSSVGDENSEVIGENDSPYLPSDRFNAVQCPHDLDTYYKSDGDGNYQAPSPYLTDGSRNPAYYQTTPPSSSKNRLADFDGRGNTNKIIAQRGEKDYTIWKPTYNAGEDYPAASCCDMFYTNGTQQGDWYLPAGGESGYIITKLRSISNTLSKLTTFYGSIANGIVYASMYLYWSSSKFNTYGVNCWYPYMGRIFNYGNTESTYYVRAFLRINNQGIVRN